MLTVVRVHLPSDIPIVGCEITPYVLLKRSDNTISSDDVPESAPVGGFFMRYRWYSIQNDKKVAICCMHPTEQAKIQCLCCLKAKIPVSKSYHCSSKCFFDSWQHHRFLHERANSALNEKGSEEEVSGRVSNTGSVVGQSPGVRNNPAYRAERNGETCFEVGRARTYIPTADDIGNTLKFECVPVDAETKIPVGATVTVLTSCVIPSPSPMPRRMIKVNDARWASASGTFTVLSYNILSEVNAMSESYSYCPSWALSWSYRRQNLLREILCYHADIVCLQEVQSEHFDEFFAPELDEHGYEAVYKRKTSDVNSGKSVPLDGCATFFRRHKFTHVKKFEVEFNKAAQFLTDSVIAADHKKAALSRLVQDNIALFVVLEYKFNNQSLDNPGARHVLCVANTHVSVPQELKDVKLWQVRTLIKGLEKIASSADIPMLVCGDFNSLPGSAPHELILMRRVDPKHDDLDADPFGILRPLRRLCHNLALVSAYTSFSRTNLPGLPPEHMRRVDPTTNEPLFTKCTKEFIGTVDYIFYTADTLIVESLLELLDEDILRNDTALPSPIWSSDHIALLAEFQWRPKP